MKKLLVLLAVFGLLLAGCLQGGSQATPTPLVATSTPVATVTATATPQASATPAVVIVETDKVVILHAAFEPANIRVRVGTKVTWENQDGVLHSVKSKEGAPESFYSYNIPGRQTYSFTFNKVGTYGYYDDVSSKAEGIVYVEA